MLLGEISNNRLSATGSCTRVRPAHPSTPDRVHVLAESRGDVSRSDRVSSDKHVVRRRRLEHTNGGSPRHDSQVAAVLLVLDHLCDHGIEKPGIPV